jgi:hypothetical protein
VRFRSAQADLYQNPRIIIANFVKNCVWNSGDKKKKRQVKKKTKKEKNKRQKRWEKGKSDIIFTSLLVRPSWLSIPGLPAA